MKLVLTAQNAVDFKRICSKIGLTSMRHVFLFNQEETREGENLMDALRRYEAEFDAIEAVDKELEKEEWWQK